jgi:hypothetical protein
MIPRRSVMRKVTSLLSLLVISAAAIAAGASGNVNSAATSRGGGVKAIAVPTTRATQESEPQTLNKTRGFQILSLVRDGSDYVLSLKNAYSKAINGYSIGIGNTSKVTTDLTIGDSIISPEQVIQERIPVSNIKAAGAARPLVVLCVLFEDGTSDGDTQVISEATQRRLGVRLQLKRIVPLLQVGSASMNGNEADTLKQLETQILSLSEAPAPGQTPAMASGLRAAKQDVIFMLQELGQAPGNIQEKFTQVKAHVDKRLAKLENRRN